MFFRLKYILFFIFNIVFFSIISLSIYELLCFNSELDVNYVKDFFFKKLIDFFSMYNLCINLYDHLLIIENIYFYFYNINIDNISFNKNIFFFTSYIWCEYCFFFTIPNIHLDMFFIDDLYYNYNSLFKLYLFTKSAGQLLTSQNVYFFCWHDFIWIIPTETTLVFFIIYNQSSFFIDCLSIYLVYPFDFSQYFIKLQCFCFTSLIICPDELLELPVIFFLNIENYFFFSRKIYFFYLLLYSK